MVLLTLHRKIEEVTAISDSTPKGNPLFLKGGFGKSRQCDGANIRLGGGFKPPVFNRRSAARKILTALI